MPGGKTSGGADTPAGPDIAAGRDIAPGPDTPGPDTPGPDIAPGPDTPGANVAGCGTITGGTIGGSGTIPGCGNADSACRGRSCRPGGQPSLAPRMAASLLGQDADRPAGQLSVTGQIVRNQ